jgi:hypothetical protein
MRYFGSAANGSSGFRLIPRIETYPKVVSFSQTSIGKSVILALFGLGIRFFIPASISVIVFASIFGLTTFLPEYRRFILAVCPITLVLLQTMHNPLLFGSILTVIILGIFLYWCAMGWPQSRFGKRPIAFLLTGFTALILLACAATRHSLTYLILWGLVGAMANYVWFIGYALLDRSSKPKRDLTLELASFRPLWGSTNTPFPKGAAYLRRIEAQNPEQLAITQLKGLKLLAWAILLTVFQSLWFRFFHGYLQIPISAQALAMSVRGTPVAWHLRWESQLLYFFESVLAISVTGHRFIAGCRMAGFNALRNTYRPLSSTTIAEFFNRFYYYYKELLVDFFFYPTFFRYWKRNRRLRMVFATSAAVVFGNAFYHFTRDWESIMDEGLWKALADYQVFFFYCAALATALSVSQLRKQDRKPTGFVLGRLLPTIGVYLFFCLLNIFVPSEQKYPLIAHLRYFAGLFFIHF